MYRRSSRKQNRDDEVTSPSPLPQLHLSHSPTTDHIRAYKIDDAKATAAVKAQIEADKKVHAEKVARRKALREGLPPPLPPPS